MLYAAGERDDHRRARARRRDPDRDEPGMFALTKGDLERQRRRRRCARSTPQFESGRAGADDPGADSRRRGPAASRRARASGAATGARDATWRIKTSQGEPRFLLERLVVEVCGGGWARRGRSGGLGLELGGHARLVAASGVLWMMPLLAILSTSDVAAQSRVFASSILPAFRAARIALRPVRAGAQVAVARTAHDVLTVGLQGRGISLRHAVQTSRARVAPKHEEYHS